MDILKILEDTHEKELIDSLGAVYARIADRQEAWKAAASFSCPDGCGDCCAHFEPDLLECEALYLAAWLLENNPRVARWIMEGDFVSANNDDGCILFDPGTPYHCTVYGGRCLICRLFGYAGEHDKNGRPRWRPCRFYPDETLLPFEHREYGEEELARFSAPLPIMADFMEQALSLAPDGGQTEALREALPKALRRLMLIAYMKGFDDDGDNDNGGGNDTPAPLSA